MKSAFVLVAAFVTGAQHQSMEIGGFDAQQQDAL